MTSDRALVRIAAALITVAERPYLIKCTPDEH
jgi:hypothetical protein